MLTYAATATDVRATMVAGQWLMQDRALTTLDAERALADALQVAHQFKARIVEIDRDAAPAGAPS